MDPTEGLILLIESKTCKEIVDIIRNWEEEDAKMDDLN